eukprot:GGOE01008937.1.p1 GENE.GGOE01008937.1~~GGOE01008937.1.p1  ORF type:complete len:491 (-),score=104.28 GGOE01008937.1:835-2307(-)
MAELGLQEQLRAAILNFPERASMRNSESVQSFEERYPGVWIRKKKRNGMIHSCSATSMDSWCSDLDTLPYGAIPESPMGNMDEFVEHPFARASLDRDPFAPRHQPNLDTPTPEGPSPPPTMEPSAISNSPAPQLADPCPPPEEEECSSAIEDPATVAPGVLARAPPPYSVGFDGSPHAPHYYPEGYAPHYRTAHAHGYPYSSYHPSHAPMPDPYKVRAPQSMQRGAPPPPSPTVGANPSSTDVAEAAKALAGMPPEMLVSYMTMAMGGSNSNSNMAAMMQQAMAAMPVVQQQLRKGMPKPKAAAPSAAKPAAKAEGDVNALVDEKAAVDPRKYKTRMCRNWEETGHCPYEHTCCFAHGLDELRNVTDNHKLLASIGYFSNVVLLAMTNGQKPALPPHCLYQQPTMFKAPETAEQLKQCTSTLPAGVSFPFQEPLPSAFKGLKNERRGDGPEKRRRNRRKKREKKDVEGAREEEEEEEEEAAAVGQEETAR